jgi:hypothetical protein
MVKAFIVLSEKHEGYAFPARWSGIFPVTEYTRQMAEMGLSSDEWVEEIEILPNHALKRSNGDIFTHDSIGRSFILK